MRILKELAIGWITYLKAVAFISRHHLWAYLFISAIINLLLFLGLGVLLWQYAGIISEWLITVIGISSLENAAGGVLAWVMRILVSILTFLLYLKLYRFVVLLFSSPALAILAEKTQEIITGISHPFHVQQLVKDVVRGASITCINLLIELTLTIPLYLLAFIPLLTPFVTILIILVESYFVGFSMIDYRNEFRRMSARDSRYFIKQHKGLAVGNGLVFNLLLAIPMVGVLIAPTLAVIAAGLAAEKVIDHSIRK